jgi:Lon protease-like protein
MSSIRIELPLFPLNTVLFPEGMLPLKIFEQRYVEMTKRCVRDGSPFGVCLIREGREVGEPAVPNIVGCTARIGEWEVPHPNLFHLIAHGEQRFRVVRTDVAALGLITCEAELLDTRRIDAEPDALCRGVLESAIKQVGEERFPGTIKLDDADWVSFRLAEMLPISNAARQRLLEIDTATERLEMLREMLIAAGVGQSA